METEPHDRRSVARSGAHSCTGQEPPAFKVKHLISEGDWLTALGDITSKDDEGNEVCHAYFDVWRFEGDKLAELRAFVIRPTIPE